MLDKGWVSVLVSESRDLLNWILAQDMFDQQLTVAMEGSMEVAIAPPRANKPA